MDFPGIVVDASAMLALCLPDEHGNEIEEIIQKIIRKNGQILVPPLFWYEVYNGLLFAGKRGRLTEDEMLGIESDMAMLPIICDQPPPLFVRQRIRDFANRHSLTIYDASYLELAARYGLRLKTFDPHLLGLRDHFDFIG